MKIIWLTKGQFTLVDNADYEWLNQYKWFSNISNRCIYAARWIRLLKRGKQKVIKMHRFILGVTDSKLQVDHIDHNGLNNQRSNLRIVTASQNGSNRRPKINGRSKYIGVCWDKKQNKWYAQLKKDSKVFNLGRYSNEIEAALAYNEAAKKYHGEFSNLNKIPL